ncbi:MAG: hypothetical protein ACQEXJ_18825 [Myxococcota bacterium]
MTMKPALLGPRLAALAVLLLVGSSAPASRAADGLTNEDLAMAWADAANRSASDFSEQLVARLHFDGGGNAYIRLLVTNVANADGRAELKAHVTVPGHDKLRHKVRKGRGDWKFGTERFDARVDDSRVVAGTDKAEIVVEADDYRARFEIDVRHGPLRPAGGGGDYGQGRRYVTTILAARGALTGEVIVGRGDDADRREVRGSAYMVHRAGNVAPYVLARRWYNLRDFGPEQTVVMSAFEQGDRLGGRTLGWVFAATDDALVAWEPDVALRVDDIREDEKSPYSVPRVVHLESREGDDVRGVIKATSMRERKDDLRTLSRVERFVVERLMKPWTYKFDARYLVRRGGESAAKGKGTYVYQQLK